jgi:hypothetical protein
MPRKYKKRVIPNIEDKINKLIIKEKFIKQDGKTYVKCLCECGDWTECRLTEIVQNRTKSCGCHKAELASERTKKRNFKHGKSDLKKNRIFRIWCAMKARCYCKGDLSFNNYGGRGIQVCEEWLNDYLIFENWSINNGYQDNLTIDRINVNGNYCPENCRWTTRQIQAVNRRNNRQDTVKITAFGETKAILNWLQDVM